MFLYFVFPGFLTVIEQPLIAESNDTRLSRTCSNLFFGFVVGNSVTLINHLLFNNRFSDLDSLTGGNTNQHDSFSESLLVAFIFSLFEFDSVFVRLNLQLLDGMLGTQVAHTWHIDERYRIKALYPLKLNSHTLPQALLGLEISEHRVIVWSVRRYTGDHSGPLVHANGWQRKNKDMFVRCHRGLALLSNKFLTCHLCEGGVLEVYLGHLLVSKVACCPLADNKDVVVAHLIKTILTFGEDKAVCLAIHGLRTQSGSH